MMQMTKMTTIAHQQSLSSSPQPSSTSSMFLLSIWNMLWNMVWDIPVVSWGSAVSPPNFCALPGNSLEKLGEKQKRTGHCVSTVQQ